MRFIIFNHHCEMKNQSNNACRPFLTPFSKRTRHRLLLLFNVLLFFAASGEISKYAQIMLFKQTLGYDRGMKPFRATNWHDVGRLCARPWVSAMRGAVVDTHRFCDARL